ncbi:hypothetical protein V6N11_081912 [Hibiscus sabdariffa]|uniref:Uncharacterized protein n=1 Tax=Hibiscus sabdariffa TaxID=183260 RepID=A0ABR2Q832_9ROSI
MTSSSTPFKIFFNENIQKKYDVNFATRTICYGKSFEFKNEPNLGYSLKVVVVFKKHKWEIFCQQIREVHSNIFQEFYALLTAKDSPYLLVQGTCVSFDEGYINNMLKSNGVEEHSEFVESLNVAKRQLLLQDLCEPSTN